MEFTFSPLSGFPNSRLQNSIGDLPRICFDLQRHDNPKYLTSIENLIEISHRIPMKLPTRVRICGHHSFSSLNGNGLSKSVHAFHIFIVILNSHGRP